MEVISTSGRGPNTIYTVKDGDRVWKITGKDNLPPEVFRRWRNKQAAVCMRNARERGRRRSISDDAGPSQPVSREPLAAQSVETSCSQNQEAPVDKQSSPKDDERDAASSALEKITCKICREKQVAKIVIPCGHAIMCGECADIAIAQKPSCPWCRTKIEDHMVIKLID